jgi:prefoldin subunit 5
MTNIDEKTVNDRIKGLTAELQSLEATHNKMVQENQQSQQQFQAQVAQNQTRYAQLQGAIAELNQLKHPSKLKGNNNDDSIPASDRSHRAANVRLGR